MEVTTRGERMSGSDVVVSCDATQRIQPYATPTPNDEGSAIKGQNIDIESGESE